MLKRYVFITIKINKKLFFSCILFICMICFFVTWKDEPLATVFHSSIRSKIVIDPGHGGIDGGTGENFGLLEKNINLKVSLKLKKSLIGKNFNVIMTRDKDVSLEEKSDIKASRYLKDLDARKSMINNNGDIFTSIHVDANPDSIKTRGVKIYYYPTSTESKRLAQSICTSINNTVYKSFLNMNNTKAVIVPDDFYVLRETQIPGVLIEIGFITNPEDRKLLRSEKYKAKIAQAICNGIVKYFKE
ncbi:N-acetylmuramoyl-L-alanine amidase family protein [Crassaminicella profunda]|uniref:N-acetylmuramoyl-L-alanine amidase family protein n=1 Tax=Crassaminicella profunda TaxID=1286698 RepID=UPI001CA78F0A|nr:N-acetylmuramoyl-L-alanine amidase [Crassaminicella profunda]QZY53682.1 N-acetylmuramoyl-L-alanine amidase [Crassaminicella profunda]